MKEEENITEHLSRVYDIDNSIKSLGGEMKEK